MDPHRVVRLLLTCWVWLTLGGIPALAQQVAQAPDALIRGQELVSQGRYNEAITILQDVVRRDPTQDAAYHNLGFAYLRTGRPADAITAFQAAIRLDPRYAPSHYGLGLAFWEQGNDTQAITAFQAAIRLQPSHVAAHHDLGLAYHRAGHDREALATLKHYLTIARAQPEQHAWFSQAEMLIRMLEGKVSSAVAPNSEPEPRALIEVPNSPTSKPSTASSLPSLPPGVLTPERRIALVIGNAAYLEQPLRNPRHDASDMVIALQEVGFVVSPVYDGDKRTMLEAIRAFRQQVRPGDVALFYYAGHGVQADGENYLIPVGARIDTPSDIEHEAVPVQRVLNSLIEAKANPSLIILDACRDNPYRSLRSLKRGLAGFDASSLPGALIAYATSPGNVAFDGSDRNGLYTKHLLRQLRKPGLGIQQMFLEVRVAVYQETAGKQTPWESVALTREFYFAGKSMP